MKKVVTRTFLLSVFMSSKEAFAKFFKLEVIIEKVEI